MNGKLQFFQTQLYGKDGEKSKFMEAVEYRTCKINA